MNKKGDGALNILIVSEKFTKGRIRNSNIYTI